MLGMYAVHAAWPFGANNRYSDDVMVSLGRHVSKLEMNKALIGWNIEQLEAAADLGGAEERDSDSDDETSDGSNQ